MKRVFFMASAVFILSLLACAPDTGNNPSVDSQPTNNYHCGIHPSMLGKIIVTNAVSAGGITNLVTIQSMAFNPASLTIPLGSWVLWTNLDTVSHNVVADNGSFSLPAMPQNGSGILQFN